MRLSDVYAFDPWTALQHVITEGRGHRLLWTGCMGLNGLTRYGSFKRVSNRQLQGRTYLIEWADDTVSIHYLDVLHDPRTGRTVPLDDLAQPPPSPPAGRIY